MQFFVVASALFTAALAAPSSQAPDPSTYENIDITDYTLRKNDGIQAIYFKLSGNNATGIVCETGAVPTIPSEVVTCGDSDYRFGVVAATTSDSDVGLAIYHQTSPLYVSPWDLVERVV